MISFTFMFLAFFFQLKQIMRKLDQDSEDKKAEVKIDEGEK